MGGAWGRGLAKPQAPGCSHIQSRHPQSVRVPTVVQGSRSLSLRPQSVRAATVGHYAHSRSGCPQLVRAPTVGQGSHGQSLCPQSITMPTVGQHTVPMVGQGAHGRSQCSAWCWHEVAAVASAWSAQEALSVSPDRDPDPAAPEDVLWVPEQRLAAGPCGP